MILITWAFWGMIFLIPFLKLGIRNSTMLITGLLIVTNLFWVGIFLVGKDYARKFQIIEKLKKWFNH